MRTRNLAGATNFRAVMAAAAVFVLLVGLGACTRGGGAADGAIPDLARASDRPETHTLTVGAVPITDLKQLFVADAQGFFEQQGLHVEIKNFGGGAEIIPAVMSGSVDLGWSNSVSILQARARELPLRFFAGGLYQGPGHWTSAIMVPSGSPIQRPDQLRGRKVAINTLANINELVMRADLERAGVTSPAPEFLEVPFPDQPAALASGRVDAAMPTEPFVTVAKQQGARVIDAEPFAAIGARPLVAAFFATDLWLRTHPNTAAAFRRAVNQATSYWNDHPERRAQIIARYTKVPAGLAGKIGFGEIRTDVSEQDLQDQIALASKYGLLTKTVDAREVVAR